MNKSPTTLVIGLSVGAVLGALGLYLLSSNEHGNANTHEQVNDSPLYWVAPMDPNFKRDKPGKSPMGMDLVPVFASDNAQESPGTVKIDPIIVHNLGVKTAKVQSIVPLSTLTTFGQVHFAQDKIVHIHPRVEGWIETLNVRAAGEYVERGAPLYSLYAPNLVNAQEDLLIALAQGNKGLISAAQLRLRALNAPPSLLENIQKNRQVERTITFFAPQSGFVSELNIQEGFYVKPSTTMLAIANMDEVWVLADIFARDVSKIETGQSAIIQSDYFPGHTLTAIVDHIYPTLHTKTRTATARLVVSNIDLRLKPDMYADVTIDMPVNEKLTAVPAEAVIRTGESERVVLALGEGKFKSINVTLGRVFDDVIEVLEGLKVDDDIVVSAQFLLDSESSIDSDFLRMRPAEQGITSREEMDSQISAWTQATVNEVMLEERMLNLSHGPLDAFNMMGMTMNFMVADDIDMTQIYADMDVHVEVVKSPSGMFEVNTVHFMAEDMNTDKEEGEHEK